jgi:capsid protein
MKEEDLEMVLKLMEENGLMEILADCRKQGVDPKDIVRKLIAESEELEGMGW